MSNLRLLVRQGSLDSNASEEHVVRQVFCGSPTLESPLTFILYQPPIEIPSPSVWTRFTDTSEEEPFNQIDVKLLYKSIVSSKPRCQWEFFLVAWQRRFSWTFQHPDALKERDQQHAGGNIGQNDDSYDSDIWTSAAVVRFLFMPKAAVIVAGYHERFLEPERSYSSLIGRYIADVMSTDILPAFWCVTTGIIIPNPTNLFQ